MNINLINRIQQQLSFVFFILCLTILLIAGTTTQLSAQTEVMAWGNLTGIRVEGQLMEFESSLKVVGKDWTSVSATAKENQRPKYHRDGQTQTVTTELRNIKFTQEVKENGKGIAIVNISATAQNDTLIDGVYFCLDLPESNYSAATVKLNGSSKKQSISSLLSSGSKMQKLSGKTILLEASKRQIELTLNSASTFIIKKEAGSQNFQLYVALMGPNIKNGQQAQKSITIRASGDIDRELAQISIDAKNPGRAFAGFGGNFRLQNPNADPAVIQYCLDNMRVAWGRVEMPWRQWQPEENMNPIEVANAGKLSDNIIKSMLMAQKLAKLGIPIILSDWSAPRWAMTNDHPSGTRGDALDQGKIEKIYKSIGDYIVYLKQNYGVEPALFSFNESDLGINIRQTGKEHADFIKGFGAYMAKRGLATKMLIGDNSDATTYDFIVPALNDPETHKYIGAVSFHSWRGCDKATLEKWAGASRKLNVPLIVAEGSTDASAHTYSEMFYEQTFALYEINLYIRICSICQPLSILQWQLTSDYSVLKGMNIYGTKGELAPTRRFWNLKQLASTPEKAFSLPVSCNKEEVNCAAFGNIARGEYAIHMVNNGAARKAVISGIPTEVSALQVFVTDETKNMTKSGELKVVNGKIEVDLLPTSFTTLITKN